MRRIFLIFLFTPFAAHAVCDARYYLSDGECKECNPGSRPYYCPGDDIQHPCPTTDTDYNQFGYERIGGNEATWALLGATVPTSCYSGMYFRDEYGNQFLLESPFNGTNYWGERRLWYIAAPGYYLSQYDWASQHNWYKGVKACTNAPEHAHYTGAGTPDDPVKTGGATDYNDCPWECDDGYGNHRDECVPLCDAGVRHIKTGNGLSFNLYPAAYSSPALHVRHNNTVCYGILSPGTAQNTININLSGTTYHIEN